MIPKIVPFKHRVEYRDENGNSVFKIQNHFKVKFGRRSAGPFWSKEQAQMWIDTYSTKEKIRTYFRTLIEARERELETAQRLIKQGHEHKISALKHLAWLEERSDKKR